jgi:acetyltransferase
MHGLNEARLSILVGDPYQGMGLGSELVRRAVEVAKNEKLDCVSATLTADNEGMRKIFEKLGFNIEPTEDEKLLSATLPV